MTFHNEQLFIQRFLEALDASENPYVRKETLEWFRQLIVECAWGRPTGAKTTSPRS